MINHLSNQLVASDYPRRKWVKASAHLQPLGGYIAIFSLTGSRRSDLFMKSLIKAALTLSSTFLLPKLGEAALLFLCMSQPSFLWPAELGSQQGHTLCSLHENPLWMFHPPALGAHRHKEPSPYGGALHKESIVFITVLPSHSCSTACDSTFLRSEILRLSSGHSSCFTFLKIANGQRLPPPFLPALERLPQRVPPAALAAFPCPLSLLLLLQGCFMASCLVPC